MKKRLDKFINHTATEIAVGCLIVASIVLTIMEVRLPEDVPGRHLVAQLGLAITIIFVIELSIRWYVARSTGQFFRRYWIDVIAVAPVVRPLRILRVLRLLRLVRLGLLVMRRTRKMAAVFSEGLAENVLILVSLLIVFLIGAIGMSVAEHDNAAFTTFGDAVWWSIYTLMAGEPIGGSPQTTVGRLITMTVMLGGFSIFAMFTGVVSAVMVARLRGGMEVKEMELEDITDHYVICGWNRLVPHIVKELQTSEGTRHLPIVLIADPEHDPDIFNHGVNKGLIFFLRGDYTSTSVLRRARIADARRVILLADKSQPRSDQDRDARTILAALTIEKLGKELPATGENGIYSCVELLKRDDEKVRILEMADVEDLIEGNEYVANLIAHSSRAFGLVQVLDELLTSSRGGAFAREPLPRALEGQSFEEVLRLYKVEFDKLVVGLANGKAAAPDAEPPERAVQTVRKNVVAVNPPGSRRLAPGEELIVITTPRQRTAADLPRKTCSWALTPTGDEAEEVSLATVRDHYLICGWNRAAPKIVRQLRDNVQTRHVPIVVVAEPESMPPELSPMADDGRTFFVSGDYTSTEVLGQARVAEARTAIMLADMTKPRSDQDRDARTILGALTIEKMNESIHSCAELLDRASEKVGVLEMARVEDVVVGDEYVGNLIAHSTRTPGLVQVLDELLTSNYGNEFYKVEVPDELVGGPFVEALVFYKRSHDALILAVESQTMPDFDEPVEAAAGAIRYYIVNPQAEYRMKDGDNLSSLPAKWRKPRSRANCP